jgi:hypothetical protein
MGGTGTRKSGRYTVVRSCTRIIGIKDSSVEGTMVYTYCKLYKKTYSLHFKIDDAFDF